MSKRKALSDANGVGGVAVAKRSMTSQENGDVTSSSGRGSRATSGGSAAKRRCTNATLDSFVLRGQHTEDDSYLAEESVGLVESIQLRNFMCHTVLDFDFSSKVNFIVGRNGSGKSAILASIVLGLGGKAAATNRASKVASVIETGKRSADIRIRLSNRGQEAYQPELYGPSIIVERKLIASGGSQYKIMNSEGRCVATKRDELQRILDQFNIQVDNPIVILNQDTSRNFLQSKNPKDKYALFMKATQLEQLKQTYERTEEERAITHDEVTRKERALSDVEAVVKKAEKEFKFVQGLQTQRDKLKRLQHELVWSRVAVAEANLETVRKKKLDHEELVQKYQRKANDSEEKAKKLRSERGDLQDQLASSAAHIEQKESEEAELRTKAAQSRMKLKEIEEKVRFLNKTIQETRLEQNALRKRIDEIYATDICSQQRDKQERLEKIGELRSRIAQVNGDVSQQEETIRRETRECEIKGKELQYLNNQLRDTNDQRTALLGNMRNLQASKGNRLQRFGEHVPALVTAMNRAIAAGRFSKPPKGPLGAHIQVRDEKWTGVIEQALGQNLLSFVTDNDADRKVLYNLFKQTLPPNQTPPTIFTSVYSGKVYDISKGRMDTTQFPTILDTLKIDDPDVANCLIDACQVERIALIDDVLVARGVMKAVSTVPKNCRTAYCLNGDRFLPAPSYRVYSAPRDPKAVLLSASVDDRVKEYMDDISEFERTAKGLKEQIETQRKALSEAEHTLRQSKQKLNSMHSDIRRMRSELNELEMIEDPEPVNVATLEDALRQLVEREGEHNEELRGKKGEMAEAKRLCEEDAQRHKAYQAEVRQEAERIKPLRDKLMNLEETISNCMQQKTAYKQRATEISGLTRTISEETAELEALVKGALEAALEVCPDRVETRRSSDSIESDIRALEKYLKSQETIRDDPATVEARYRDAKERFEKMVTTLAELRHYVTKLEQVLRQRYKCFKQFRNQMVYRVSLIFKSMLLKQNYIGQLNFDHENCQLNLEVHPDSKHTNHSSDVKGLSGGERSFSMVCFILALWDAMDAPFRIMDEFDIFMDMGKRRVSLQMILETTQQKRERQFIFLTPIEMPTLSDLECINVLVMPEPARSSLAASE